MTKNATFASEILRLNALTRRLLKRFGANLCRHDRKEAPMATMRLISMCALFAALAACNNPTPRGSYDQGVSQSGRGGAPNAPYYQGADPSHRPRSGGSN